MKSDVKINQQRKERVAMNDFTQGMQTQALIDEQTRPSWQEVNRLREENERLLKEYNQLIKGSGEQLLDPR